MRRMRASQAISLFDPNIPRTDILNPLTRLRRYFVIYTSKNRNKALVKSNTITKTTQATKITEPTIYN